MRLLICTQTIDRKDPALGFFVRWVEELSKRTEHIEVICLKKGEYELPQNVRVHSLGKELGPVGRVRYALRFYRHLFALHGHYDAVFVHMNQEYVLLGGLFWKLAGKRIYLWRNHYEGNVFTDIAALLCDKVFCTSKFSYTAKYLKTVIMPVGVDIKSVRLDVPVARIPNSILFLGRLDPSKRPDVLLTALARLAKDGVAYTATFVGRPTDPDSSYPAELQAKARELSIAERVSFVGAVPNTETFRYYRSHELFVNVSRSGMLDKTTFKAIASGCLVLSSSQDLAEMIPPSFIYVDGDAADLARGITSLLNLPPREKRAVALELQNAIAQQGLTVLAERLTAEMAH